MIKRKLHRHTPEERRRILERNRRRKAKLHTHTPAEQRRIRARDRVRGRKGKDGYTRKVDNSMKGFGETDFKKKTIRINKSKKKNKNPGESLDTIVHEEQHRIHPGMKEKNIKKRTKKVIKKMSKPVKVKMYSKYAKVAAQKAKFKHGKITKVAKKKV